MNQNQIEQLREHIDKLETSVSRQILKVKELKDRKAEAELETIRLEEELAKLTRTGRQPLNKSGKGGTRRDIKQAKDKYERRNSFEGEDEGHNSSMYVPEDDECGGGKQIMSTDVDSEAMTMSPQTRDTILEQTRKMQEKKLSVIMDEEEDSHYFEESEFEFEGSFVDEDGKDTLEHGKSSSKQRKSKRKAKQEKRAKKQIKSDGKGGVCGAGNDKACCTIF